jgi:hypothetical protein
MQRKNFNIYITSDEEIKEGDWCYYENGDLKGIHKVVNGQRPKTMILKKIILTTDNKDLIKDGVQAIDDTFLEWFVKNPSCEWVEVRKIGEEWIYNADVPKEPKQQTIEEANWKVLGTKTDTFYNGAKWAAERMYSEEDMITFIDWSKSTNQEKSEYELKCLLAGVVIDSKTLFNMWAKQLKKNN